MPFCQVLGSFKRAINPVPFRKDQFAAHFCVSSSKAFASAQSKLKATGTITSFEARGLILISPSISIGLRCKSIHDKAWTELQGNIFPPTQLLRIQKVASGN